MSWLRSPVERRSMVEEVVLTRDASFARCFARCAPRTRMSHRHGAAGLQPFPGFRCGTCTPSFGLRSDRQTQRAKVTTCSQVSTRGKDFGTVSGEKVVSSPRAPRAFGRGNLSHHQQSRGSGGKGRDGNAVHLLHLLPNLRIFLPLIRKIPI